MRYMAIDPGSKRTGLAVGDDVMRIASPLSVIDTPHEHLRLDQIAKAVDEHDPDALVVGLPLNMDGSEGEAVKKSRAFAQQLQQRCDLPVHFTDERLSSAAAEEKLDGSGLTHDQKKARRDALAAAVILQTFLDQLATGEAE